VTVSSNKYFIKKGGQSLDGLEFLLAIGLNKEADKRIDNYNQLLTDWRSDQYSNVYVPNRTMVNYLLLSSGGCLFFWGYWSAAFFPIFSIVAGDLEVLIYGFTVGVIGYGVGRFGNKILKYSHKIEKKKIKRVKKNKPEFKLGLSYEDIKNLSESYNRRLFNDIAKK